VAVGGNIGEASLSLPPLLSDESGRQGVYVLELSSYQLEMTNELAVDGGIFLNLTPDHLTRHGTMENYCATKYKLFQLAQHGATLALGVDQPILRELTLRSDFVGLTVNAGLGENTAAADYMVRAGALWRGLDKLMALDDLPHLQGPHNAQNVACAYALLVPRWVTAAQFAAAAKSFRGLPHRLEKVGVVEGVDFVNDSKATNGDSAVYALQSFKNIYWICGGLPKSDGLGACVDHLGAVRAAFCIGVAAAEFARALEARGVVVFRCGTLDVAVREAFATARTENLSPATVLLAPAAASQDQFRNFEHRGDVFVNCVQALALPKVGTGRG
jgi:UDP-N-acetylmuramoylalanine--D-glutamate ligase